jgi:hypothetical protein
MAPFWCQIWHTREHSRFASAGPISLTSILMIRDGWNSTMYGGWLTSWTA